MKLYISSEFGTVYYNNRLGNLCGLPIFRDGVINTDESFIIDKSLGEVSELFYDEVGDLLKEAA